MSEYPPPNSDSPIEPIPVAEIVTAEPLPAANEAPSIATPMLGEHLPANEPQIKPARLLSLDVFRGITLAMMTLVNNEGSGKAYTPLDHADWGKGWTPTDLVFPFFLFIVGVAIPFSLNKRSSIGQTKSSLLGTIWTRALALFMVGQLLSGIGNLKPTWYPPSDALAALPETFHTLHILRWVVVIFAYAAIVALLIPWRPSRRAWLLPVGICAGFYGLAGLMGWANHYALTHGAPPNTYLGGGLLHPAGVRIPGILQRIGFCYGVGATIMLYAGWRTALLTLLATCSLYTVLMIKAPYHNIDGKAVATGTISNITEEQNFARAVDNAVFNRFVRNSDGTVVRDADGDPTYHWHHTYGPYPDNEGIISTLPAIANVLIGTMAGLWLRTLRPAGNRCAGLFVFGIVALLLGSFLDAHSIPINKTIWSPSYAIYTGGLALIGLGICFYVVDINQYRRWAVPFVVLGMNSIAVFVANGFVYRISINTDVPNRYAHADWSKNTKPIVPLSTAWKLEAIAAVKGFDKLPPVQAFDQFIQNHVDGDWPTFDTKQNTSLAYAASFVVVIFLLMLILYACKIFVKI